MVAAASAGPARADDVNRGMPHGDVPPAVLLRRRRTALGANAELSYDRPLHLVRGEGVWVYTADGERLLDVYNNVPHVGHAHPVVVAAMAEQAKRIASNTRYLDERIIEYVERLTATLPPDLDTCLFVNSGSEANDIAWRIAKSHTGHDGALVMTHAYHGITDAITALSPAICAKVPPHVEQLAAPNAARRAPGAAGHASANFSATRATVESDVAGAESDVTTAMARLASRGFKPAALMIDSALTSSGIYDPSPTWVAPIAAAVRKAGALVIADEVQFGLGRSGSDFWGFARRGYHPDIVTLGKPVGNGYPLGVVITRRSILEKFQRDTGFFSTFGGNPVAGAAGLAVLDVLQQEQLVDNARTTGNYFIEKLRDLATKYDVVRDVRGCGLMIGVEVTDRTLTKHLVNSLRDRGVLIGSEGPMGNVLKLRPPMPFRPEHVDFVIEALTAVLSAAHP
jgi:4-aminobutyrate aminotransferase-like enzyme